MGFNSAFKVLSVYQHGPSEEWFPNYYLLMIKENALSVPLEVPCRHCGRQTSGILLSSTTSDWCCLP